MWLPVHKKHPKRARMHTKVSIRARKELISCSEARKVLLYENPVKYSVGKRVMYIKKESGSSCTRLFCYREEDFYIMPPIPPPIGGIGIGFSSFLSAITHSVVRNIPATDAAFSSATRLTLVGSITPAARRFS